LNAHLGIGLIGCGLMGRSLGKELLQVEGAKLVAVADPSEEALAKASEELGAPGFADASALLARPEVDAVIIASPGFLHRKLTEQAAALGKHVFVEKPMATYTADCDAMTAAAEKAGIKLMVGQVLRYYPCWWQVLELVRQGEVGQPWGIHITRIGGGWGGWAQPWRNSRELSGGLLMEVNAHEIDFMCQIGGDVTRVYAEADKFGPDDPADYPNLYFLTLRFANGAVGSLHTSTVSAIGDLSGKVQGSEGTLIYTSGFGANGEIRYAKRDGQPQTIKIPEIEVEQPVRKELRLFVEAVRSGGDVPIPAAEGRRNVAIAEAAYESARTGLPVEL
jgi:UDP-N-acetylglucosamine 3-dehydrogenase